MIVSGSNADKARAHSPFLIFLRSLTSCLLADHPHLFSALVTVFSSCQLCFASASALLPSIVRRDAWCPMARALFTTHFAIALPIMSREHDCVRLSTVIECNASAQLWVIVVVVRSLAMDAGLACALLPDCFHCDLNLLGTHSCSLLLLANVAANSVMMTAITNASSSAVSHSVPSCLHSLTGLSNVLHVKAIVHASTCCPMLESVMANVALAPRFVACRMMLLVCIRVSPVVTSINRLAAKDNLGISTALWMCL